MGASQSTQNGGNALKYFEELALKCCRHPPTQSAAESEINEEHGAHLEEHKYTRVEQPSDIGAVTNLRRSLSRRGGVDNVPGFQVPQVDSADTPIYTPVLDVETTDTRHSTSTSSVASFPPVSSGTAALSDSRTEASAADDKQLEVLRNQNGINASERARVWQAEVGRIAAEGTQTMQRKVAEQIEATRAEADRKDVNSKHVGCSDRKENTSQIAEAKSIELEKQRQEKERIPAERAEIERREAEEIAAQAAVIERQEAQILAAEKAETERKEACEKAEQERREVEVRRMEEEQIVAEMQRKQAEQIATERAEQERELTERMAAGKAEERNEAEAQVMGEEQSTAETSVAHQTGSKPEKSDKEDVELEEPKSLELVPDAGAAKLDESDKGECEPIFKPESTEIVPDADAAAGHPAEKISPTKADAIKLNARVRALQPYEQDFKVGDLGTISRMGGFNGEADQIMVTWDNSKEDVAFTTAEWPNYFEILQEIKQPLKKMHEKLQPASPCTKAASKSGKSPQIARQPTRTGLEHQPARTEPLLKRGKTKRLQTALAIKQKPMHLENIFAIAMNDLIDAVHDCLPTCCQCR